MNAIGRSIDISVCIANYNGGEYVLDCLESVYSQHGDFSLEVIVHDDASTDESSSRIKSAFPDVKLLNSSKNVGFCISNNRMVEVAAGRFVLLLNNDAILRPGSLEAMFVYANAGHDMDVLGLPQYTLIDGSLVDCGYRADLFLNPIPIFSAETHEAGVATGACLWIPRKVWNEVGGFPPWFGSIAEDIFLCFAARLLGYRITILATPGFDHWIGRNLGGGKIVDRKLNTTVRRRALSERNKTFVLLMCYPALLALAILPLHALLLLLEALFLLLTGSGLAKVEKIYGGLPTAIWRYRADVLQWRRQLMDKRRTHWRAFFSQSTWFPQKLVLLLRHGKPTLK
ncbi:glycosyltransferase family 2 protein [Dyella sp.]|uniref:glycosyltransferase family 2 protein n=1 Tax=Dyella sp. TaxID=1869338 RepID=UPI002FDAC260